ncbi:pentapeptide repeat-containing protein [Nodosilinea sp. FACHB-13]|nr:pentapeptide repeat-containing protein [Nodosilinea sp. FACHB-13]
MTKPGRYQGKRLSATEVTRLYAAGERDFRGAVLRGCNFHRVDLSRADFSGADIRSARFVEATLEEVNFSHARAGLQRRWVVGQLLLIVLISVITGFLQGFAGAWIGYLLTEGSQEFLIAGLVSSVLVIVVFLTIARQGFTLKALGSVALAVAVAFASAFAFAVAFASAFAVAVAFAGAFAVAVAFAFAGAFAVTGAIAVAGAVAGAGAVVFAFAFAVTGAIAGAVAFAVAVSFAVVFAFAFAFANLLLSLYISRKSHRGDPKFENLRIIGLAFTALGGTTFSSADLTGGTLAHAILKSANFADWCQRPTTLTHVRWHQAQQLDRARLGIAILQDPRVRLLLTTLNGIDQDLSNADLRGANLAGAKLHRANLTGANLSGAILHYAELHEATLTEANCVGTDLTAAQLTGACLEAWNIDSTTILKDIDCQYVFLRKQPDGRGDRERRPHNPDKDFQPGDFEKFFKDMLDTVQLLIRNGVNPDSFKAAFQSIIETHPDITADSIQGFERKGDDVLVTIQVPEATNKADIERTWDEVYEARLTAATAAAQLEAEKRRADDIKDISLGFSRFLSSVQINNMNNPINTGDGSFYAGGDVNLSGSTLNLGQISGQVTNQLNQIPAPAAPDQPDLRDILTQLKTAVETDGELSNEEKAEALQAVARIATAGTEPNPDDKTKGIVKRATTTLKGMTETLTDASKLAEACTKLLPLVLSLFALL